MKINWLHVVNSLAGGLAVIGGLNPALFGPYAGYAAVAIGVATIGANVLHAAMAGQPPAVTTAVKDTAVKAVLIAVMLACLVSTVATLSACSTLAKLVTPGAQPFVAAAADVAVATAVSKGISAKQIKSIAQEVLAVDQGEAVTLTSIQAFVNTKIAGLNLPAGDVAASQILLAALSEAVQQEISSAQGKITPTTQAAIAEVLNDVIVACAAYGA